MLFSATQTRKVEDLARISLRKEPLYIGVDDKNEVATADRLEQGYVVCPADGRFLLLFTFLKKNLKKKIMVFFSSCNSVKFHGELLNYIDIPCLDIHGRQKQAKRTKTFFEFCNATSGILLCTDVAARGLDIPEVDLVVQCEPPRDVDSYIHRSGRTGRAGRAGVCIIMYSPAKEFKLREVERKAGIKFKPLRAPQLTDIVVASARDAKRSIEAVPDQTLPLFEQAAQELMDEKGALKAVCAALAFISGNGSVEITERSALSSLPGFTAYQLWTESEVHSKGLLWSLLDKFLPEVKDTVKGAKITKDKHGIVFDV